METNHYYTEIAAAFVRGKLGAMHGLSDHEIISTGIEAGLRLHKFKRNTELPRVKKVLGLLRGLAPSNLLDIGSGRGTFLWPLVDSFPELPITAIDKNPVRADNIGAVRRGGIANLDAALADATSLCFAEKSFDVVTVLEVMEHLPSPENAVREVTRIAQRFVVVSVPSKEDDNPEHIHLFDNRRLESMFLSEGAKHVKFDYVLNHIIAIVKM
jgi:2-polyprenyl-3-methyl-5-hydroxy-6-metoxy-1,4-benzoquinol methylase